jgi:hypothetical protein
MKMLGLVVAAALAAMAFVGAGSASATTLCKANENPCNNPYPSGTKVKAQLETGTEAVLTTSLATVKCTVSKSEGVTKAQSGEPLPGEVTNLTFESCKTGLVGCTVSTVNLPYTAAVSATGGGNGTFTASSSGKGNPGAKVVCVGVLNCTFTTAEATLTALGGEPARLKAEGVELEQTGELCPTTSTWTATYKVTEPTKGWVVASP